MNDDNHWFCCDNTMALCGADLTDHTETQDDIDCLRCIQLEALPCKPFGCDWPGGRPANNSSWFADDRA